MTAMTEPMSDARFAQIKAMKFTTGINAACGVFDTPVERELYDLAAKNYNARLELEREVDRLRALVAQIAELHEPMGGDCGYCADETESAHRWPCPTAKLAAPTT